MKADIALLLLRITFGGTMLFGHGWNKLMSFSQYAATFPDPIGFGSSVSLALTVFAEVFCAAAVLIGAGTKYAAVPLAVTMGVAFFIFHGADPWSKKEMAFLYLMPYISLILLGGGRFSVDAVWAKLRVGK